ncbi:MAG: DEAD/DEAH box helicase [Candidatus Obscuribacter sp.]|nr:DEAD/DEAH box helicase [Candidatus Obscuribacter sp.]
MPAPELERQRQELAEILTKLRVQPGVILADEVGMGKTFVALAVAYTIATKSKIGPVIIMMPASLVEKWEQDLKTFCELYVLNKRPINRQTSESRALKATDSLRYGIARHSVELMKLLDDKKNERCHFIFLAQGAMARKQTDKWVRLAIIREALKRHGRGAKLRKVRLQIHRFMAMLLCARGEERATDWGDQLWNDLLKQEISSWKETYNLSLKSERGRLTDDPVPKAIIRALSKLNLQELARALEQMPLKSSENIEARIADARARLKEVEDDLWKQLLTTSRWRSPLLVMDEAHHLKNPTTSLARQFQEPNSDTTLITGDGALAQSFERMLFLTATPFQLGHHELINVLRRFSDVKWNAKQLGDKQHFLQKLEALENQLTECQRAAISLRKCWENLQKNGLKIDTDIETWWEQICSSPRDQLRPLQRDLLNAFEIAKRQRSTAEPALREWMIRHNKGDHWRGTTIARRLRFDGGRITDDEANTGGLSIPIEQILPFYLAARSAADASKDLLAEALSSSYEAFRDTKANAIVRSKSNVITLPSRDNSDDDQQCAELIYPSWYLSEFDSALQNLTGKIHPKIAATVKKTVDLWQSGEKVLVFAFYRETCKALRIHISNEIMNRLTTSVSRLFAGVNRPVELGKIDEIVSVIKDSYFGSKPCPQRTALDTALRNILKQKTKALTKATVTLDDQESLLAVMRRYLGVNTSLVRAFPLHRYDQLEPTRAVEEMLNTVDNSGISWRAKFEAFIEFLIQHPDEREVYLKAVNTIAVNDEQFEDFESTDEPVYRLPNVRVATGTTKRDRRANLIRAFNTPFFPDVLVCSQVMGEGIDLQRHCRHIIHHDLSWNPSSIEQRTGRVDRLGCKAESKHPINVYIPYLDGAADDRQYRVMTDREQWFRIVMGQNDVSKLIPCDNMLDQTQLPKQFLRNLTFDLSVK